MNKSVRAAAVATAAVLAVGVSAPASFAKPHATHASHHVAAHGKSAHAKPSAAERRLARAEVHVAREALRKDAAIVRNVRDSRFSGLSADWAGAVQGNAALDEAALQDLAAQAAAATTRDELRAVAAQVHAVRPEGYLIVENQLRHAAALQAEIDTLLAADPTAATGDAAALVTSAVDKALAYRASDPKSSLRSIQSDLAAAAESLDALTSTGTTDTTDTGTTEPAAPVA